MLTPMVIQKKTPDSLAKTKSVLIEKLEDYLANTEILIKGKKVSRWSTVLDKDSLIITIKLESRKPNYI